MHSTATSKFLLALVLHVTSSPGALAGGLVYFKEHHPSPVEFRTFDPATGLSTFRSTLQGTQRFYSLDMQPSTGVVFGFDLSSSSVFRVDVDTGVATLVGPTGHGNLGYVAFDPTTGNLFGLARNPPYDLYSIDPTTGAATTIGTTIPAVNAGLACSPTGELYAARLDGTLWKVDKQTAATTHVGGNGSLSFVVDATFDDLGRLYFSELTGRIHRVDLATGASQLAGDTGFSGNLFGIVQEWPIPFTYCTAKLNSVGCLPAIDWSGNSSATTGSAFFVRGTNVRNQKLGLLLYTKAGRAATAFQGGFLCLASPIHRSIQLSSAGSPLPASDCSGVYRIDMNSFAAGGLGGNPAAYLQLQGTVVDAQFWGRDPGFSPPNNSTLTDALEFIVGA